MPLIPHLLIELVDDCVLQHAINLSLLNSPKGKDKSLYVNDKDQFKVHLDVQQFKPEELKVSVEGGFIIVDGKHEEKSDEHGFISRQFRRKYNIPQDMDPKTISSKLSSDGVLSLQSPKLTKPGEVRELPITFTDAPFRIQGDQKETDPVS